MLPERAVIDGIPVASVTSLRTSEYETPSEVRPNSLTKNSAMRRDSPVSLSARDISIAIRTSQTDGVANPLRARSMGTPPTMMSIVTPITTICVPGRG